MKKVLGFACAIAMVCFVTGCGGDKTAAKTESAKSASGTTGTENKNPQQSADSEGTAPKQNNEPETSVKVQTPGGDINVKANSEGTKVDAPEAKIEVESKAAPKEGEKAPE